MERRGEGKEEEGREGLVGVNERSREESGGEGGEMRIGRPGGVVESGRKEARERSKAR